MRHTLLAFTALAALLALPRSSPAAPAGDAGPRLESIRYEPRPQPPYHHRFDDDLSSSRSNGVSQLHAGFFDPQFFSSAGVLAGIRAGAALGDHAQVGIDADWSFRYSEQTVFMSGQALPTGGTAQVARVLARSYSHLVPVLGYLQLGAGRSLPLSPYVGAGAGYEFYFVISDDFANGTRFNADYGGFAWQGWAGIQIPLSPRYRLAAEAFVNQADLGRNVEGPNGVYRETVNLDGAGMRFGINWGF